MENGPKVLGKRGLAVIAGVAAAGAVAAGCLGVGWDDVEAAIEAAKKKHPPASKPDGGTPYPPPAVTADLQAVYAVTPNDVWVVGTSGTVLHFDGSWHVEPKVTDVNLYSVWAMPDGTVWAGGAAATTLRRSGGIWTVINTPGSLAVRGLWGTGTELWAAAEGTIYRWDGAAWQLSHTNSTPGTYNGIWGAGARDIWVVGEGFEPDGDRAVIFVHWDGTGWTESYACNPDGNRFAAGGWIADLNDISGTGADAIWAAGECRPGASFIPDAFVEHRTGGAWNEVAIPSAVADFHPLRTIWASSESDVWAASSGESYDGNIPTMLHFDGTTWTASADPATVGIFDLGGTGPNDIWAVGLRGKRLHFNGTAWTPSP